MSSPHAIFTAEHDELRAVVRRFVDSEVRPNVDAWERAGHFPDALFRRCGELGFLGLHYPARFGGSDGDLAAGLLFVEELARCGAGAIPMAISVQSHMATPALAHFGTDGQRDRWLVPAITGEKIGAIAITEPDAGSDVAAISTNAVRDGDVWRINGRKMFITNGTRAHFLTLVVKTDPGAGHRGISLFIVDTSLPGVSVSRRLEKLGMHSSDTAEIALDDVPVPHAELVGLEPGQGFAQLMWQLQYERLAGAAASVGHATQVLDDTIAYARERKTFGRPISEHQVIAHKLADAATELEAARSLLYSTAWRVMHDEYPVVEISMTKKYCAQVQNRLVDACVQVFGGAGYLEETPVARAFRDARLQRIGGGTDEIMNEVIAKRLGLGRGRAMSESADADTDAGTEPAGAGGDPAAPSDHKIAIASPLIAFGVLLVALIPVFLWAGRGEWFEHDDWDYLVQRKAGDLGDLVRPHNGHWETIPVLVYRMIWSVSGLTYRPFQLVSIILSFVGAALFLVVLLRARTRPWIALIFATLLVLFAPAQTNVALKVTSITFVGFAVPLGLAQLLLADHDGPRDRRDWFALAAGLLAVLCSSVAVAMLFVVGVAMLVKRGWRVAVFQVGPPAVAFAVWFATTGHKDLGAGQPARLRPLPAAVHFASVLVTGTFEAFTRTHTIGGLLVLAFLAGLFVLVRRSSPERRREVLIPLAMLLGAFVFAVETGIGRSDLLAQGASAVRAGHYMDVVAYLTLPAVAFVAEELVRRWRVSAPVLIALFVVAVPLNLHELVAHENARAPRLALFRNTVLLIPRLPIAHEVPPSVVPYKGVASPVTVGWLLHAAREGRLPQPHVTPVNTVVATLRMSLVVSGARITPCHAWRGPVVRHLEQGTSFRFRGSGIQVGYLQNGKVIATVTYATSDHPGAWRITNVGAPLTLQFNRVASGRPVPMVCA